MNSLKFNKNQVNHSFIRNSKYIQILSDKIFDPEKYYVLNPWCDRIGHLCMELMLGISVAKRDKKKLVLIPHFKPVNTEVFKLKSNCTVYNRPDPRKFFLFTILYLSGFINWLYNGIRIKILRFIPLFKRIIPELFYYPRIGIEKGLWNGWYRLKGSKCYADLSLIMEQKPKAILTEKQKISGILIREKLGIPEDQSYCCLHVRERGYLKEPIGHLHEYRNSNINNYLPAIKYLVEKGTMVVRLGDSSMQHLPIMDGVIDYALTESRSDLMDLYFAANCDFFIGCDSGPLQLALLFNKPTLSVNYSNVITNYLLKPNDVNVPKHIFSHEKNRILSFKEVLNSDLYPIIDELPSNGYAIVENTSEELLNYVKEFVELIRKNNYTDWCPDVQEEIRKTIGKKFAHYLKTDEITGAKKENWLCVPNFVGLYGKTYLNQCWEYSEYLENLSLKYIENSIQ